MPMAATDRTGWFQKVLAAGKSLQDVAHRTPVMTSRTLDEQAGVRVLLKCENFQRIGAFKFRGAYNAMRQLSETQRRRGVLTFSSGNHAQAVALVGRLLGVAVTVVMPKDAPQIKRAATEGYGARVIDYDPAQTDRQAVAESLRKESKLVLIPPYDHAEVIAGQGTAALELLEAFPELDGLLVPCGGGGLLSGSAIAAKSLRPGCRVVGVEPETADDAARSFHSGVLHKVHNPPTIADGTRTPSLGELTFPLLLQYVDDMWTVSEADIIAAVKFLFYRLKLVVEPSGALGVAALRKGLARGQGTVGVILSGGNIDGDTIARIVGEP